MSITGYRTDATQFRDECACAQRQDLADQSSRGKWFYLPILQKVIKNPKCPFVSTDVEGTDAVDLLLITLRVCVYSSWELAPRSEASAEVGGNVFAA